MTNRPARPSRARLARVLAAATATTALASALLTATPAQASGQTVHAWLTTPDGTNQLTQQADITLGPVSSGSVNVAVNDSLQYQTISGGFGAAFTDSSTYLMAQLKSYDSTSYNNMMSDLFTTNGSTGIGQNFWRLPMTSSDFNSTSTPWTADDTAGPSNNPTQNFALTAQDTGHIIPVIKDALALNPNLKIVASPWSAPAWMKSNNSMIGNTGSGASTLQTQYYQAWADYFVKWIQAYQAAGVPIWGITPQNEPLYSPTDYPGMAWTAAGEESWVHNYLLPDLSANGLSPVILGMDHNWENESFAQDIATSSTNGDFGGIAYHCYDNTSDPTVMTQVHNIAPSKDAYETECSSDTQPTNIIKYSTPEMALLSLQNWAKGVILWNTVLNSQNGPHLGGCTTCVPETTVNATTDGSGNVTSASYTEDNNFYQFGQISRFVANGAVHIGSTVNAHGIVTAAVQNPDGTEALIATNTNSTSTTFTTTWNGQGSFSYTLPSRATVTFTGTIPAAPVLSSTPAVGHTFRIVNRTSGKPIGVYGASTANGGQIVQFTDDDDHDQQWTLNDARSGHFNLMNVNSGLAMDDTNGSTANGNKMQQWQISGVGNSNQQWSITSNGDGYYRITNLTSGLVLDDTNGSIADANAIQQWAYASNNPNQEWQFVPVS
jgi:glucosylceramidase